jgi:hypothetical protein
MNKLIAAGAVSSHRIGRETLYQIEDESRIARLLIIYKSSFMDKLVDRALSTWMEKEFTSIR